MRSALELEAEAHAGDGLKENPRGETRGQDEAANDKGCLNGLSASVKSQAQADLFGDAQPQPPALIVNADAVGRACRFCANETFIATPPKPPHAMGIKCVACGRHNGWVPADIAADLRRKGRPS
jgi:hypothetical protein